MRQHRGHAGARTDRPDRVRDVIWWHVHPLGFAGAEQRAEPDAPVRHRLAHLIGWLDHAVPLGASGIALGPVFASSTHGYDTVDHLRIDPRLGDDVDFDAVVAACRSRDLRLLLDGVLHHVGRDHPAFRAVLGEGPSAPTASWFRLRWPGGPQAWTPGTEPGYDDFEGHAALVALDHTVPAVVDRVAEVMAHWLDRGADGWRLDGLLTARTATLHLTDQQLVHEVAADGERLVVALSIADRPADLPAARAGALLAGAGEVVAGGRDDARVRLAPQGWAVLAG